MKSTMLWTLVALNALLLTTFVLQYAKPNQALAQNARPGDYMMLPGEIIGGNSAMVYIIDATDQKLGGVMIDQGGKLRAIKPYDLRRLDNAGQAPGRK